MTPLDQLKAAAALQREATPGPWHMDRDWYDDEPDDSPGHPVGGLVYGELGQRVADTDFTTIKSRYGYDAPAKNGAFIVAARNLDLTAVVAEIEAKDAEIAELRRIRKDWHLSEGGWIYQGDGEDHLESLVCPVVIQPETLMELHAEIERLRAELESEKRVTCRVPEHPKNL